MIASRPSSSRTSSISPSRTTNKSEGSSPGPKSSSPLAIGRRRPNVASSASASWSKVGNWMSSDAAAVPSATSEASSAPVIACTASRRGSDISGVSLPQHLVLTSRAAGVRSSLASCPLPSGPSSRAGSAPPARQDACLGKDPALTRTWRAWPSLTTFPAGAPDVCPSAFWRLKEVCTPVRPGGEGHPPKG